MTTNNFRFSCVDACILTMSFPFVPGEQLVYGDSKGHVVMLLCGTREWPARDLISTEEHQDYIYIHQEHSDWVSQVIGRERTLMYI
jgi:hypothetical protein